MSCPYCGNGKAKKSYLQSTAFNGKIFDYDTCLNCGVIYLNPLPQPEDYDCMYPTEYQGDLTSNVNDRYDDLFASIRKLNSNCKTLLDYGCGNAELLVDAKANDFDSFGVEYNPNMVKKLNEFHTGISFLSVDEFNEKNADLKHDVIVLNNVLEHVINPNELLLKLQHNLNPNGLIVVLGPIENNFNIALLFRKPIFSFKKFVLKRKAAHAPYHITFTNYKNQREIFKKNNLVELLFVVNEVAWPFPNKMSYKSTGLFFKSLIALISIKFSTVLSKNAGNMFTYIGKKQDS